MARVFKEEKEEKIDGTLTHTWPGLDFVGSRSAREQFHVDISAAMFSLGLINSRIRPQFAELGLLIFTPLIIKPAAN